MYLALLGALAKLQERLLTYLCAYLSVRPHGTNSVPAVRIFKEIGS